MVQEMAGMVVAMLMAMPGAYTPAQPIETAAVPVLGTQVVEEVRDFRAVWVTTVINLDFPSRRGLSNAEIMREIDYIVAHSASIGLNAIILQVRPAGDAIYPSEIFPWSKYITGEQGLAPPDGFDPLGSFIERAHAAGLELHAWINPYRVTHSTSRITDVNLLHPTNPARQNPHLTRPNAGNTALYLDPGHPESRRIIVEGVAELLRNYPALDGIHLDDYFYPRDFDDSASFAMFGAGRERNEWRRDNVNMLIRELQQTVREHSPTARFGISPTGIWANRGSNPLGSDTRGNEHFTVYHADSRRWVQEGWIDYIVPQIYWHIGFDIADYATLLRWWEDVVRGTNVNLYIGHAAWREYEGQDHFGGEIIRQLAMNEPSDVVRGSVFFRWRHVRGNLGDQIRNWYAVRPAVAAAPLNPNLPPSGVSMTELAVVMPSGNTTIAGSAEGHNIWGSSVPHLPLLMNGEPINQRTAEGFFAVFAPLQPGENILQFTQPGQPTVTRVIHRGAPQSQPGVPAPPPVAPGQPGQPAPPAGIIEITAPNFAMVTAHETWLHPDPTISGGANQLLTAGQTDRIIAQTGDGAWLRLGNGYWVRAEDTEQVAAAGFPPNSLDPAGIAVRDGHIERVTWRSASDEIIAARADWQPETRRLTVYFGTLSPDGTGSEFAPSAAPGADSIFSAAGTGRTEEGVPYAYFTLADGYRLEGFDVASVENVAGEAFLELTAVTRRPLAENPFRPFEGFTFVVDAGHGGDDPGALGPMGRHMPESHIVLRNAQKLGSRLEQLGAAVIRTRTDDSAVSLRERVRVNRNSRPDMFISLHGNSVAETTDATGIRGFTVWYRNETSRPAAAHFMAQLQNVNPLTNRWPDPNQANLYVTRPTWTPSILLEHSFMSNIHDFAWMINPQYQEYLADATVRAMLGYYMR